MVFCALLAFASAVRAITYPAVILQLPPLTALMFNSLDNVLYLYLGTLEK